MSETTDTTNTTEAETASAPAPAPAQVTTTATATMIPSGRCEKAILGLYFLLFLLVMIMAGTVISEGSGSAKGVSWALYAFSIIAGIAALFFLFRGGKLKKYGLPILTVLITLLNLIAMTICKPELPVSQLFTPHFANICFSIVAIIASILST